MKKSFVIAITLLLIFLIPLILAQDPLPPVPQPPTNTPPDSAENTNIFQPPIDPKVAEEKSTKAVTDISKSLDNSMNKELVMPEFLKKTVQILLGYSPISASQLVIALALAFLFFITFKEIFSMFSMFSESTVLVAALCITVVTGVLGVLKNLTNSLIALATVFKVLSYSRFAYILIILAIIFVWSIVLNKISEYLRAKKDQENAEKAGLALKLTTITGNALTKTAAKISDQIWRK